MKKFGVLLCGLLCAAGTMFASLENTTTFALFYNDLDNVLSPVDIFLVEKNIVDLGYTSWQQTSTADMWTMTFGLVNVLPVKLGGYVGYMENVNGNPTYNTSHQFQYLDLAGGDGILDTKRDTMSSQYEVINGSSRNIYLVAGLGGKLGISYGFSQNITRTDASYSPGGAVSTSTHTIDYDLSGNLLSSNATIYNPGFNDASAVTHQATVGLVLSDKMQLSIPLVFSSSGTDYLYDMTSYTVNPGATITDPYHAVNIVEGYGKRLSLTVNPTIRMFLKNDGTTEFALIANLNGGVGFRGKSLYSLDSSETIVKTMPGLYVQTATTINSNSIYRTGYLYLPLGATAGTYVLKTINEVIKIGVGAYVNGNYITTKSRSSGTNYTLNITDLADGLSDTSDSRMYTYNYAQTSEYYNNMSDINLTIPIAAEIFITKSISLRFGTQWTARYFRSVIQTTYLDDEPTMQRTVYGDGSETTTYTTGAVSTTSPKLTDDGFTTQAAFSTGMSFMITEDFIIDMNLNSIGNIFDLSRWNVELRYRF